MSFLRPWTGGKGISFRIRVLSGRNPVRHPGPVAAPFLLQAHHMDHCQPEIGGPCSLRKSRLVSRQQAACTPAGHQGWQIVANLQFSAAELDPNRNMVPSSSVPSAASICDPAVQKLLQKAWRSLRQNAAVCAVAMWQVQMHARITAVQAIRFVEYESAASRRNRIPDGFNGLTATKRVAHI